jgi:hypothetical protein
MSPMFRTPSIVANVHFERKSAQHWSYEKFAVAATIILSLLAFTGLAYLLIWYLRRRLRSRRVRSQRCQHDDIFGQSVVSLAEDTSKALDEFLMTDVQPQRSSIMRRRSRSPSITMVFEDKDYCDSAPRSYLTSHDTSTSTLIPVVNLAQVSAVQSGPSVPSASTTQEATSGQRSSSSTPRASMSSMVPTARSSQMWTTASANTDTCTLLSRDSNPSQHSQIASQSPTSPLSSRGSRFYPCRSNTPRGSGRPSSTGILYSSPRLFNDLEFSRRRQARTLDLDETTPLSPISPILVDVSTDLDQSRWASSRPPDPFPFHPSGI